MSENRASSSPQRAWPHGTVIDRPGRLPESCLSFWGAHKTGENKLFAEVSREEEVLRCVSRSVRKPRDAGRDHPPGDTQTDCF